MSEMTEAQIRKIRRKAAPTAKPAAEPEPSGPSSIFDLQRSAGNAAVVSLLTDSPVQTKLEVGAVNDPAEAEADRIADQVLRALQTDEISRRGDDAIRRDMPPGQIFQATVEEDKAEEEQEEQQQQQAPQQQEGQQQQGQQQGQQQDAAPAGPKEDKRKNSKLSDEEKDRRGRNGQEQQSEETEGVEDVAGMFEREDDEKDTEEQLDGVAGMYEAADAVELHAGQGYQVGSKPAGSDAQGGNQEQESAEKESEEDSGQAPKNPQNPAPQNPPPTNGETEEDEKEHEQVNRVFRPVRRAAKAEDASGAAGHGYDGGDVESNVAKQIESARGGGRPLDDATRTRMESGFGADFSDIRLHSGSQSEELNRSLNAQAFTTGRDIFVGKGGMDERVLAHELAHTVQQGAAVARKPVRRFMAVKEFEGITYESKTALKGTAQKEIIKMLTAYAQLSPAPAKKGAKPTLPPEKLDNAIRLVQNMKDASRAYIDAKKDAKNKKPRRLAGFVSFEIDCALELEKLNTQKAAATNVTQEPVSVDEAGLQKLQAHYKGTLSGSMEKAALAVEQLAGENGASGEFTLDVDVPVSPGVFVGAHFKFEAKRGGKPNDPKPGMVEVNCELGFKVGGDALFAKIEGGIGGYFKAAGKDAASAMKLVSYGLYRRCRESSVIPAGVGNKLWGGDSGAKGKKKAEDWSLAVEEEELNDEEGTKGSFVETGAYAAVKAKGDVGIAEIEGEVKASTGKKYDKESLKNSAKGGAGEENTTGDILNGGNFFAQKSTGRSVSALELSAKATLIEAIGAELKLGFQWESSGVDGEASRLRGFELQVKAHGSLPSGAFADKLSAVVIDFATKVKSLQKGQLQKASTTSQVGAGVTSAAGIADTTVTGIEGAPTAEVLKDLVGIKGAKEGAKAAAKGGAKKGAESIIESASKVGIELAYTFKYEDGACFSQFEILHRKQLDAKIPGFLDAELIRRKRLLVGSNQNGAWSWELMA